MKKILSFIVVATMLMATVLTASAAPAELGIGLVPVLYANSDMITIDGNIEATEWDETNSIMLSTKTNMATWTTDYPSEIQFFYSWGDDGLYMAAKVIDSTLFFTSLKADDPEDVGSYQDRFQIAFNPCGIIYDRAPGLFFSFYPVCTEGTTPAVGDMGEVQARKHNWQDGVNDDQTRLTEAGYKGAYKVTKDGWDMEVILPWSLIAQKDRTYDIIDDETEAGFCSVLDPKNEDRTKAFTEAIIAYVDNKELDDKVPNTARTVTADGDPNDWTVASYDITLKFYMEGESTDDKTVTEYTVDELKAIFKDVDWTAYDEAQNPETEGEGEDDPIVDDTAAGNDETDASTKAPATGDASTTAGDSADEGGNSPVIWIVIAAVAVVAIAAVAIVISKKKK